jgi:hypothetical protein
MTRLNKEGDAWVEVAILPSFHILPITKEATGISGELPFLRREFTCLLSCVLLLFGLALSQQALNLLL